MDFNLLASCHNHERLSVMFQNSGSTSTVHTPHRALLCQRRHGVRRRRTGGAPAGGGTGALHLAEGMVVHYAGSNVSGYFRWERSEDDGKRERAKAERGHIGRDIPSVRADSVNGIVEVELRGEVVLGF